MKKNLTELAVILDRSGSMSGLENDTIGGYNSLIDRQRELEGDVTVTTVLFDDKYEILHDRVGIVGVAPITKKEYYVRGCTALFDAVGKTIAKIDNAISNTTEPERPVKVIVVITTDGYENASREYTLAKIRSLIESKREQGWEFVFMGANIDSIATATSMGIDEDMAADYIPDHEGMAIAFDAANFAVEGLRISGSEPVGYWKKSLNEDVKKRG